MADMATKTHEFSVRKLPHGPTAIWTAKGRGGSDDVESLDIFFLIRRWFEHAILQLQLRRYREVFFKIGGLGSKVREESGNLCDGNTVIDIDILQCARRHARVDRILWILHDGNATPAFDGL